MLNPNKCVLEVKGISASVFCWMKRGIEANLNKIKAFI